MTLHAERRIILVLLAVAVAACSYIAFVATPRENALRAEMSELRATLESVERARDAERLSERLEAELKHR
jgi:hypothetical protein